MSKINEGKPEPRDGADVVYETWTKEELNAHLHAMMNRKEESPDETPDDLRREFIEVLDQYPRHMADDAEARRYRERMEAMLSDDDQFGGPSPDHLKRSKSHGWQMAERDITRAVFTVLIVLGFLLALDALLAWLK